MYQVEASAITGNALYDTNPVGATVAPTALTEDFYVKTTETKTLYFEAENPATYFSSVVVELKKEKNPGQAATAKGVWSFVVDANVDSSSFVEDVTLAVDPIEFTGSNSAVIDTNGQTTGSTIVTKNAGSKAEITAKFTPAKDNAPKYDNVKVEVAANGKLKFTETETQNGVAAAKEETIGRVEITVKQADGVTWFVELSVAWSDWS